MLFLKTNKKIHKKKFRPPFLLSEQFAINSGAHNWQSTFAVKHLEKVIENAKAKEDFRFQFSEMRE